MKYELPNKENCPGYVERYLKALENNEEKFCFIGDKSEYRIRNRDSQLTTLTDVYYLLKDCIYPLYLNGDKEIGDRIRNIMFEILKGEEPDAIFQVAEFISAQDFLGSHNDELPLIIKVDDIVPLALKRIDELSEKLRNYKEGEIAQYAGNMYEMLERVIGNSKSFQNAF